MAIDTTINLKPTVKQLRAQIKRKMKAVSNFDTLNRKVAVKFEQWVLRNFQKQGQKANPKWPPLKAGGRWKKSSQAGGGSNRVFDASAKVLQDTGALRNSFFPAHHDKHIASIGSRLPYAAPHNEGEGHLPKRQLIPEWEQVERDVLLVANAHAKKALKKK